MTRECKTFEVSHGQTTSVMLMNSISLVTARVHNVGYSWSQLPYVVFNCYFV